MPNIASSLQKCESRPDTIVEDKSRSSKSNHMGEHGAYDQAEFLISNDFKVDVRNLTNLLDQEAPAAQPDK